MIATGGSGGHIFPAVSLADKIKQLDSSSQILLVGARNIYSYLKDKGFNYQIRTIALDKGLPVLWSFKIFVFLVKFFKSLFQAKDIVNEFKPDIVVGFGAYASVPVVMAAGFKNRPIIIHEQNVVPGLANSLVASFARKIAVSFLGTSKYFDKEKVFLTGNPIRKELLEKIDKEAAREKLGLDKGKFTILIMGGSKGAHIINLVAVKACDKLDSFQKEKIQVIHLSGEEDFSVVCDNYNKINIKNMTFSFYQDMRYAFSAADLVIARAGATTIAEITALAKPAILVPYPYARSHQLENTRALSDRNACILIEQKDFNEDILKEKILNLMEDKRKLQGLADNSKDLAHPDAAERLADLILRELN